MTPALVEFKEELVVTFHNIPASFNKPFKLYVNSKEVVKITNNVNANTLEQRTIRLQKPKSSVVHNVWIQCVVNELEIEKMNLYNLTSGGYHLRIFINTDKMLSIVQSHEKIISASINEGSSRFACLSQSKKDEIDNLAYCLKQRFITEEEYVTDVQKFLTEQVVFDAKSLTQEQQQELAHLHRYVERNTITELEFNDVRGELLDVYKQLKDGKITETVFVRRKRRILGDLSETPVKVVSPSATVSPLRTNVLTPTLSQEDQTTLEQMLELKNMGVFTEQDYVKKREMLYEKYRVKSGPVTPVESIVVTKAKPLAPALAVNTSPGAQPTLGLPTRQVRRLSMGGLSPLSTKVNAPQPTLTAPTTQTRRLSMGLSKQDADDIKFLAQLKDEGVLTQEEFDIKRKKILFPQ
jgi:hypothetical protein